jgi:hypothetical protein
MKRLPSGGKPNLRTRESQRLEESVTEFQEVFATKNYDCGRTDRVYHRIDNGDAPPIRKPPRRLPLAKQAEVNEMLQDMEGRGVIEETDNPWSLPAVPVRQKDGDLRLCVKCRKLNDVTEEDCFPLPRINDTLDTLAEANWFSTLDLKIDCWKVALHPDNKDITAFSIGQGLWQTTVMAFGICKVPATFEHHMESLLRGLTHEACLVYLDDVIVGRTFQEQLHNEREVIKRFRRGA